MSNYELWKLFTSLFNVQKNNRLEEKVWFRFLKVIQGFLIVIALLTSIGFGYLFYSSQEYTGTTLTCNDGSIWDIGRGGLTSSEKCGACTQRTENNNYKVCDVSNPHLYDSYLESNSYKRTYSDRQVFLWTITILIIELILIKISAYSIQYILGGSENT